MRKLVSNDLMRSAVNAFEAHMKNMLALASRGYSPENVRAMRRAAYQHTKEVERVRWLCVSAGRAESRSEDFYTALDEFIEHLENARPDDATASLTAYLLCQKASRCK